MHDQHVFEILPRRWFVEWTFVWISKHRRALMTHRLAEADAHLACRNTMSLLSTMRTDFRGAAWISRKMS